MPCSSRPCILIKKRNIFIYTIFPSIFVKYFLSIFYVTCHYNGQKPLLWLYCGHCYGHIADTAMVILQTLLWSYCGHCYGHIADTAMVILRTPLWLYCGHRQTPRTHTCFRTRTRTCMRTRTRTLQTGSNVCFKLQQNGIGDALTINVAQSEPFLGVWHRVCERSLPHLKDFARLCRLFRSFHLGDIDYSPCGVCGMWCVVCGVCGMWRVWYVVCAVCGVCGVCGVWCVWCMWYVVCAVCYVEKI